MKYAVEAWWPVLEHAWLDVEADSPEAALAKAKADLEWIGEHETCDGTDGPMSLTVWTEGGRDEIRSELAPEEVLARAAPDLLAALRELIDMADEGAFIDLADVKATPISRKLRAAIAKAEGRAP